MLPSFTVKDPRLQLVKFNHVILVYLSLNSKTVRLWKLIFISWLNHCWVFNKFKLLNNIIWIKIIFIELLLQRKLSSEYTIKLFNLAGLLTHVQQFCRLLNSKLFLMHSASLRFALCIIIFRIKFLVHFILSAWVYL